MNSTDPVLGEAEIKVKWAFYNRPDYDKKKRIDLSAAGNNSNNSNLKPKYDNSKGISPNKTHWYSQLSIFFSFVWKNFLHNE